MPGGWLSPTFVIGQIKIGSIEGASCFNLGNNLPSGFTSRKVHNQGFGSVEGSENRLSGLRTLVHETPAAGTEDGDTPSYEPPEWIMQWMKDSFADADPGMDADSGEDTDSNEPDANPAAGENGEASADEEQVAETAGRRAGSADERGDG